MAANCPLGVFKKMMRWSIGCKCRRAGDLSRSGSKSVERIACGCCLAARIILAAAKGQAAAGGASQEWPVAARQSRRRVGGGGMVGRITGRAGRSAAGALTGASFLWHGYPGHERHRQDARATRMRCPGPGARMTKNWKAGPQNRYNEARGGETLNPSVTKRRLVSLVLQGDVREAKATPARGIRHR
jgi:hypothetical protein